MKKLALASGLLLAGLVSSGFAAENSPRAARSVHLGYYAPEGVLFYNEMKVTESTTGSYFMACGFNHGYFGIQEIRKDYKVVIFSVWDPGDQNNPNSVSQDKRVKVLHGGKDVRISRFGGEGTGAKSMFKYDWKIGHTYKFCIKAQPKEKTTVYSAYFYMEEDQQWKHLASFETITGGQYLRGYYSFVEDFRRDGASVNEVRKALYGNGWIMTKDQTWISLTKARFTADSNTLMNIDAGVEDDWFFLTTGGKTENNSIKLWANIFKSPTGLDLPADKPEKRPETENNGK